MQKIWFSIYDFSFDYKGTEPAYAIADNFEWANELSRQCEEIKKELKRYLSSHDLPGYFNSAMVSKKNSWKTISLRTWGIEHYNNKKEFPLTASLIAGYPQIVSASFSLLEPNSKILLHCGDTNAMYRCHLGLEIPAPLPDCGLKVKGEEKGWEEGKWLIFMDAYQHEAWNNTGRERYILIIDVIREQFLPKAKFVCSTVLTSLFLQRRAEKYKFLLFTKPVIVKIAARILRPFVQLGVYLANQFKYY